MRKFAWGIGGFGLSVHQNWWDGPYWDVQLLFIWAIWNIDGLPYIFQDRGES
jgi:hypothetical protein